MSLIPFDPAAACPKCHAEMVDAVWHAAMTVKAPPGWPCADMTRPVSGEHMCRVCTRCGYGWCEIPADGGKGVPESLPGTEITRLYEQWMFEYEFEKDGPLLIRSPADGSLHAAGFKAGALAASRYWQVRLGLRSSYPSSLQEDPVSIRKTGSAAPDQVVTGIEQDSLSRTASFEQPPLWGGDDEAALAVENEAADASAFNGL